jgi:hypothetical protein
VGEVILGSNQENAAYPSGLAQKVLFYAGSMYPEAKIIKWQCSSIWARIKQSHQFHHVAPVNSQLLNK